MFIEKIIGDLGDKRRWRQYKARIRALPANYRTAAEAVQRYLMFFGGADGGDWAATFEDLADLFEQAAADRTPIRELVGEDPVEFVETFVANYAIGQWKAKERDRFIRAIERAEGNDTNNDTHNDTANGTGSQTDSQTGRDGGSVS